MVSALLNLSLGENIVSIFMKMHQTVLRLRRNLLTNFFDVEVVAKKCPSSPRCLKVPKGAEHVIKNEKH